MQQEETRTSEKIFFFLNLKKVILLILLAVAFLITEIGSIHPKHIAFNQMAIQDISSPLSKGGNKKQYQHNIMYMKNQLVTEKKKKKLC